jgi:hypothetical protein
MTRKKWVRIFVIHRLLSYFLETEMSAALLTSDVIQATMTRYLAQPKDQMRPGLNASEIPIQAQKNLLRQLLRDRPVT